MSGMCQNFLMCGQSTIHFAHRLKAMAQFVECFNAKARTQITPQNQSLVNLESALKMAALTGNPAKQIVGLRRL